MSRSSSVGDLSSNEAARRGGATAIAHRDVVRRGLGRMSGGMIVLLCFLLGTVAFGAEPRKLTVGVFLPTSFSEGSARLAFSEGLAAKLGEALGRPAAGRNFGRYEDFAKALAEGSIDLAVVDAWAAAQGPARYKPIALGVVAGQTQRRWTVVARSRGAVVDLAGKRLAISRGVAKLDPKFLNHVIFAGDYDASRKLKLVPTPSVESALQILESKGVEAALVPSSSVPANLQVIYQSPKLPIAVAIAVHGDADEMQRALLKVGEVEGFEKFVEAKPNELEALRKVILKGPPKQQPLMAESPLIRPDAPALLNFREVGLVLPSFLEDYEVSKEQPDD